MNEQQRVRAALAKLTDVLTGIARTADEKNRERCPYKTVELRCTYAGGCQNQRRESAAIQCLGDELIEWSEYGIRDTEYGRPNHELRTTDHK
jgi:ribosome modulation factor